MRQENLSQRGERMLPAALYGALTATAFVLSNSLVNVYSFPNLPLGVDWLHLVGMWAGFSAAFGVAGSIAGWFTEEYQGIAAGGAVITALLAVAFFFQMGAEGQAVTFQSILMAVPLFGVNMAAAAEALRPLTEDEVSPIRPEAENKSILINIAYQTLSCFEGDTEVYFARVSTGALFDAWGNRVDVWSTPVGAYPIWRKLFALNLSGGGALDGWDLPAVGWTSLFVGSGVAIHSTYWHNNYGEPSSRGCVNCSPDDAKWIFRWTHPVVSYEPGDLTVSVPGGTIIKVVEG